MDSTPVSSPESGNRFRHLTDLCFRFPKLLAFIIGLSLLSALVAAPAPYLAKIIIDELIFRGRGTQEMVSGWLGVSHTVWMLSAIVLLGVGLRFIGQVISGMQSYYILQITRNTLYEIRLETALRVIGAPQSFFENMEPARIASRVGRDVNQMDGAIFNFLKSFVSSAFLILTIIVFMLMLNPWLTLIILVTIPLTAVLSFYVFRKTIHGNREESDRDAALNTCAVELFSGVKIIRSFNAESYFLKGFQQKCEDLRYKGIQFWTSHHSIYGLLNLLSTLGGDIFLLVGGVMALRGEITFGEFFAFYSYQAMLWGPIGMLLNTASLLQNGAASAEKVMELREAPQESYLDKESLRTARDFQGEIVCENLCFNYHEDDPILQNVNLRIAPGTMSALVGQSGSGKTTLASLLMGLYLPKSGRLLIDGVDIRQWDLRALRAHTGIVLQDPFLFNDTIRNNIALGRTDVDDEHIWAALRLAHLDNFVHGLPGQLDTRVGVSGARLSGGQKQRIAIARVFLKNPKLIILDEATSALDSETEKAIQRSFDALMTGRTAVVIAHRLSTIYQANQIIVLHQGRLVESGTHEELAQKPQGHYRELYEAQVEGMIPMSGATRSPFTPHRPQ